jgi:hypothetical protein
MYTGVATDTATAVKSARIDANKVSKSDFHRDN